MERIGIRELRQHASQYLARVAADREPIEITDRGRPIARLVPITNDDWANMIAAGDITPADPGVTLADIAPLPGEFDGSGALRELRDAER